MGIVATKQRRNLSTATDNPIAAAIDDMSRFMFERVSDSVGWVGEERVKREERRWWNLRRSIFSIDGCLGYELALGQWSGPTRKGM